MSNFDLTVTKFTLQDYPSGKESEVSWNRISIDKWVNMYVYASEGADFKTLKAKIRKIKDDGTPSNNYEQDLDECIKLSDNNFKFIFGHYGMERPSYYLIRVADTFDTNRNSLTFQIIYVL